MNSLPSAWTKYAHLGNPSQPTLHPLTPAHIKGEYEKGRWARANNVAIKDCPYAVYSDIFQEWCVGWLKEDEEMLAAKRVNDGDFVEWE